MRTAMSRTAMCCRRTPPGCYLYAESRLVATVGLKDHVVVETKDAVLVAPKDRVQDVKKLVNRLKEQGRYEHSLHREVFRPWGSYDRIESGARFVVNRVRINPGASQSLQLHHHRAEHWVVVSGTARITRGEEVFLLEENQSAFIPIGVTHRIENPGKIAGASDRSAVRILPGRGRHRAPGGSVRAPGCREGLMTKLTAFKAYDVRGRIPDEINDSLAYDIGRAYAGFVQPRTRRGGL